MEKKRIDSIGKPPLQGMSKHPHVFLAFIDTKRDLKPMLGFWRRNDKKQWVLAEKIADPCFNERFWAFKRGDTYFFVTDSGKVYAARKPDKGDRKLEPLWVEKGKPVVAAITDTASGKTFLFGRNDKPGPKDAKGFWFELDEKLRPRPFDPKAVEAVRADLLKTVAEYARFLHAAKKLKLPALDK
jgi:hypothetical protein